MITDGSVMLLGLKYYGLQSLQDGRRVQNFCTQVEGNKRQISPLSLSLMLMAAVSLPRTSTTELKAERVGLACALLCTAAKMAKN